MNYVHCTWQSQPGLGIVAILQVNANNEPQYRSLDSSKEFGRKSSRHTSNIMLKVTLTYNNYLKGWRDGLLGLAKIKIGGLNTF